MLKNQTYVKNLTCTKKSNMCQKIKHIPKNLTYTKKSNIYQKI
jgi:hypothetical protein